MVPLLEAALRSEAPTKTSFAFMYSYNDSIVAKGTTCHHPMSVEAKVRLHLPIFLLVLMQEDEAIDGDASMRSPSQPEQRLTRHILPIKPLI